MDNECNISKEMPNIPPAHWSKEQTMVRRARQRFGPIGVMMAAGMIVFDQLLGKEKREEAAVIVETSGEPGNIDNDGITLILNETTTVFSPAPCARVPRPVDFL
jgi:hypothetical protein